MDGGKPYFDNGANDMKAYHGCVVVMKICFIRLAVK